MAKPAHDITVYIKNPVLRRWIESRAKKERRSRSATIVNLLEDARDREIAQRKRARQTSDVIASRQAQRRG